MAIDSSIIVEINRLHNDRIKLRTIFHWHWQMTKTEAQIHRILWFRMHYIDTTQSASWIDSHGRHDEESLHSHLMRQYCAPNASHRRLKYANEYELNEGNLIYDCDIICIFPFLLGFTMKHNTKSICRIKYETYAFQHNFVWIWHSILCDSHHQSESKVGSISFLLIGTFQLISFTGNQIVGLPQQTDMTFCTCGNKPKCLITFSIVCGFPSRTVFGFIVFLVLRFQYKILWNLTILINFILVTNGESNGPLSNSFYLLSESKFLCLWIKLIAWNIPSYIGTT